MSTSSSKRNWVLPAAAAIPLLACIYAFSLGPSPVKVVKNFEASSPADVSILAESRSDPIPFLIEEVKRPTMSHRPQAIEFLARQGATAALPTLRALAENAAESQAVRAAARQAIAGLEARAGRAGI